MSKVLIVVDMQNDFVDVYKRQGGIYPSDNGDDRNGRSMRSSLCDRSAGRERNPICHE